MILNGEGQNSVTLPFIGVAVYVWKNDDTLTSKESETRIWNPDSMKY